MTTRLIHGEALATLRGMPDGCVDAVITDPPFGVGFKYLSHDDSPKGYGEWLWSILSECERLCRPGSPVFVWQAAKSVPRFHEWFPRPWRLFIAAKSFAQILPGPMWPSFEPVVVWWTPGEAWFGEECRRDFHLADTSPASRRANGDVVRGHPCPRPLAQVRHVIRQWVRPGGCILDPFGGSGTTALAALREGRDVVLIEKDEAYFAVASRRISEAEACRDGRGVGELFAFAERSERP